LRTTTIRTVTTVDIGAGHAGLAMSRCLCFRRHVVLEHGEIAHGYHVAPETKGKVLVPDLVIA